MRKSSFGLALMNACPRDVSTFALDRAGSRRLGDNRMGPAGEAGGKTAVELAAGAVFTKTPNFAILTFFQFYSCFPRVHPRAAPFRNSAVAKVPTFPGPHAPK